MLTIFILFSAVCCIVSASGFVGPTYSQGYYGPRRVGQSLAPQYSQSYYEPNGLGQNYFGRGYEPRLIGQSIRPIYSQDYYGPTQVGQSLAPQYSQSYYEPNGLGQSYFGRGYEDRSYVENTAVCEQECLNGSCIAPNECLCEDGYKGLNCGDPICNPACENGGICEGPDECDCRVTGYYGPVCQYKRTTHLRCPEGFAFSICFPHRFCVLPDYEYQNTLCDGTVGCPSSGADEKDVYCNTNLYDPPYCEVEYIRCSNFWNHTCSELIGKGTSYCPDGEDLLPDISDCGDYKRYCDAGQGGKCFSEHQMCNGVYDCEDGTDEDLCNENFYGPTERTFTTDSSWYYKGSQLNAPTTLQNCRDQCNKDTKCNAFAYSESYQHCEMVEFLEPGPPYLTPWQTVLDYKGYVKFDILNSKYGITGPYDKIWGYDTCKWTVVEGSDILLEFCIADCIRNSPCDGVMYTPWSDEAKGPVCVRADCPFSVPLPDGNPDQINDGLRAYAIHKAHLWNGPYGDQTWSSSQCEPINDYPHEGDLKSCKKKCQTTHGCNAMHFRQYMIFDGPQVLLEECFFMKCPHPIPSPGYINPHWFGYSLSNFNS